MKCVIRVLVLVWITSPLTATEADAIQQITIEGEYIALEQSDREGGSSRGLLDTEDIAIVVSKEQLGKNDEVEVIELASGSFVDGKISLEIEVEESTEAQISVVIDEDQILSSDVLIVPGGE